MIKALERKLYHWLAKRAGGHVMLWHKDRQRAEQAMFGELAESAEERRVRLNYENDARAELVAMAQRAKKNLVRHT